MWEWIKEFFGWSSKPKDEVEVGKSYYEIWDYQTGRELTFRTFKDLEDFAKDDLAQDYVKVRKKIRNMFLEKKTDWYSIKTYLDTQGYKCKYVEKL